MMPPNSGAQCHCKSSRPARARSSAVVSDALSQCWMTSCNVISAGAGIRSGLRWTSTGTSSSALSFRRVSSTVQRWVDGLPKKLTQVRAHHFSTSRGLVKWEWKALRNVTFLSAFHSHFTKPLDVEKWWALTCVSFFGSPSTQRWTVDETRRKLNALLDVPVEVHLSPDRMPAPAEITLQEVIQHWDRASETTALERALAGLELLQWHCAPELGGIIAGYETTIRTYLHDRDHGS